LKLYRQIIRFLTDEEKDVNHSYSGNVYCLMCNMFRLICKPSSSTGFNIWQCLMYNIFSDKNYWDRSLANL